MKTQKMILLVEDDKDDQFFFVEAVKEIRNATVTYIANNGKEALEKLKNSSPLPDLIFMDINMPYMDGLECLIEIKKNPQTKNIPVVMLSSNRQKANLTKYLGANAFVIKPDDTSQLYQQLTLLINLDFNSENHSANLTFQNATQHFD